MLNNIKELFVGKQYGDKKRDGQFCPLFICGTFTTEMGLQGMIG